MANAAIPPRIAVVNCRIPIVFKNISGIRFNLKKSRAIKKRKKAFELFLKQRIKRENKYYTIPRKDRFIYREMLKKLESI